MTGSGVRATAARVTRDSWAQIGKYLDRQQVHLLSVADHRSLQDDWKEITHQEETLDDAILIGLVGGTGVGKSTFINALAGQEVSRSSDRRPTTDRVVVYRHVNTEVGADVPTIDFAQPPVLHDNDGLEKVVLFDFPDFDSAEESHTHIIRRYLPFLDVLLVVVDDVKYADRRLYELLSTLDHDHANIYALLNKVDRLEGRYGDKTEHVIQELLDDLQQKMKTNSGIQLKSEQCFPIAALSVFESRASQKPSPAIQRFRKIEAVLEAFQGEKHRRAAKTKNIESRKQEVAETLIKTALGSENTAILADAKRLVGNWRSELDQALQVVSADILADSERRGVRRSYLRRVGPTWGIPFSLFFTLIGELRRKGIRSVDSTELGPRVMSHYRSYFESVKNARARFSSEFLDSKINMAGMSDLATGTDILQVTPNQLARNLQCAVQPESVPAPGSKRWLAHLPAIATFCLAIWSRIHPILESALGTSDSGIVGTVVTSLIGTLSPLFLVGTALAVIVVYLATTLVIWLREVQSLDARVTQSERETRQAIKASGQEVIDQLDTNVRALYEEFEQLESVVRS